METSSKYSLLVLSAKLCFQQLIISTSCSTLNSNNFKCRPLNILQSDGKMVLIDMDASVPFGEVCGRKISSAYSPPEMILKDCSCGNLYFRIGPINDPLFASHTLDMWALGCVFYFMCTGVTLFHTDTHDNLVGEAVSELYTWKRSLKNAKLSKISDPIAKNLVSQLLSKEPTLRPDIDHVLSHPFMTGRPAGRLPGMPSAFKVFISYRVKTDKEIARALYDALKSRGIETWLDEMNLVHF